MSTAHLTDDLISIACGSLPGEMRARLDSLLRDAPLASDAVADEVRRVIGLLRLQAKSMEQMAPVALEERAQQLGLDEWVRTTKQRASALRADADEFEKVAREAGILPQEARQVQSLRGMWRGMEVTDEDIEEAKRSLFPKDMN